MYDVWYSSILGWRLMAHTAYTAACCWLSSYCLSCVRSLASSLSSSKTVLLHTEHSNSQPSGTGDTRLRYRRSLARKSPHLNPLTTEFGEKCSSGSTRRKFMTLMNRWPSMKTVAYIPRDVMHSADAVARCMSVRLSVTRRYSIETKRLNVSSNLFHHLVATSLYSLSIPNGIAIPTRSTPPPFKGVWKIAIFDQYLALSRKWYKIGP